MNSGTAVSYPDTVDWVSELLHLMKDAPPPEVDTELVRQLGQQGLSQLERRHDDLEVLRAEHGCHPGGEEGRVEDLLRGHDHPEHGLQSGVPHTRARAGRLDLDEDGEQDPGELGRQLPSGLLLVPRLAIHGRHWRPGPVGR